MIYYKVLKGLYTGKYTLIKNELITRAEMKRKYKDLLPVMLIKKGIIEIIEISSKKTYFMFGCRFEKHED